VQKMNYNQALKNHKTTLLSLGVLLFVLFGLPLPKYVEVDFYDFHVWECEQAHAKNMSYSLCSGFWYEPSEDHINNPCVWHPSEDSKTIPHGSNLGTLHDKPIFFFGIIGWFLAPSYI